MDRSRPRWRAPREIIERARQLRNPLTTSESTLWLRLRGSSMCGYRFRRQHPIGPFIADFFCPERKLVIEIDGGIHAASAAADEERTKWLKKYKRCTVIRFTNEEVERDLEGVLKRILEALEQPPL